MFLLKKIKIYKKKRAGLHGAMATSVGVFRELQTTRLLRVCSWILSLH